VIANEITALSEAAKNQKNNVASGKSLVDGEKVHLYLRETEVSASELVRLRDTLLDYPGPATVFLHMLADAETVIELPEQVRIASSPELEDTVAKLFGPRVSFQPLHS
jgi:hypothetical protein